MYADGAFEMKAPPANLLSKIKITDKVPDDVHSREFYSVYLFPLAYVDLFDEFADDLGVELRYLVVSVDDLYEAIGALGCIRFFDDIVFKIGFFCLELFLLFLIIQGQSFETFVGNLSVEIILVEVLDYIVQFLDAVGYSLQIHLALMDQACGLCL